MSDSGDHPDELVDGLEAVQQRAALSTLMAGMVHDTRNIMTGLLSFAQIGKRESDGNGVSELFENIEADTLRCIEIFDRLLRAVRGDAEGSSAREIELSSLVRSAAALVHGKAQLKRVQLRTEVDEMMVFAAPTPLLQILLNLMINAVEATPEGGVVRITTSHTEHDLTLCVRDTGHGIPPDQVERVFEPYFTTKREAGTGLGLSTSVHLAATMDATLTLAETSPKGTSFCLTLPLRKATLSNETLSRETP